MATEHSALIGRNARETAYNIIRDKIINLELKPGESLSDKQLAEELEMSRTPVREALIILSISDMVVLKPQTGTFVAPIDVDRMEIEQYARYALEKEVLSELCEKGISDEVRWSYEENMRLYRHYAESELPDRERRLLELDNSFHRIAFSAAGRLPNYNLQYSQQQHIERMRMLCLTFMDQRINTDDHSRLYEAISHCERDGALVCLKQHLNRFHDNLGAVRKRYPDYFKLG
ncbi:MAG: GntR family transcriptional regulator [Oscillospiraceae bacterium]|nr:GntR family transcriptional regulator [Oscillospiraceae bacterium]